jgi:hypothetical protein
MMDALPPQPPALIAVEAAGTRAPLFMLGFFAFGSAADLDRLHAATAGTGLASRRVPTNDASLEQGVLFPPGSDRAVALNLFRRARDGEFGQLRVEVVVVPAGAVADGIDLDSEVSVEAPGFIVEPNR